MAAPAAPPLPPRTEASSGATSGWLSVDFRFTRGSDRKHARERENKRAGSACPLPGSDVTRPTSGTEPAAGRCTGSAALRPRGPPMAGWGQDAVTFEDVAVYLSRAEWDAMGPGQRELYHRVMMENYNLLSSLGYPGPKPDILCRMERGEEPWVSAAQSPVRWDGPPRPSPGQGGPGTEEPSSWWDGGGGSPPAPQRTQPPDQGGRRFQWRLRCQRLLRTRPGDPGDGGQEVAGRGAGPGGRQEQIRDISCSRCCRKGKARAERRIPGAAAPAGPVEGLLREQEGPELPGEEQLCLEELQEVVWRDHCYCGGSQPWFLHPLREHNYCRGNLTALRDHGYCHPPRAPRQDGDRQPPGVSTLCRRRFQIRRIIHRARRVVWSHRPLLKAPGCPRAAPAPPDGDSGGVWARAKQEPALPQARGRGSSGEGSSEGVCTPRVPSGPRAAPSPLNVAVRGEPRRGGGRGSPRAEPELGGGDPGRSRPVLLYGVCRAELLPREHLWDPSRHSPELSSCSLRKLWANPIRRDS